MPRALIVVDVQPTFCEGGSLPVAGGNACAKRIADFLAHHGHRYDLTVTTQDWHINPGAHFSDTPDYVDTWPPHGIAGSDEAELHPSLAGFHPDVRVKKGQYSAAYSGFEGVTEEGQSLENVLRIAGIDEVDVVGLAQSHCVCETALDAKTCGFSVRVLRDLTEAVSPETGQAASARLTKAGIPEIDSAAPSTFTSSTAL